MPRTSAGLLMFRRTAGGLEVLLVHPGGPLWTKKDLGAWSIPKGIIDDGEDPLDAACRELTEETGAEAQGPFIPLGEVRLKSGKRVAAWAAESDFDTALFHSNTFEMEWPPRSGRMQHFPEADRAAWFAPDEARRRINPAQAAFIDRLLEALG